MYLLFDIGGTNTRIAVSSNGKTLDQKITFSTPESFDEIIVQMKGLITEKITGIAGGIAAPLNREKTKLENHSNLPATWVDLPIQQLLEDTFQTPVFLENDAAIVGLGEAVVGAGKGKRVVIYITVSTGVGGAYITNGEISESAHGFEPGHQIINFQATEPICPGCQRPGHLEAYVAGPAIEKRYGKKPEEITDEKIWDEVARILAVGLNNTFMHWSCDVIVLGGSVMKSLPIVKVQQHLNAFMTIFPEKPVLALRTLESVGGLYGAMVLLNKKLDNSGLQNRE
jgi:predicted NBD/HSP70 family sugar kinase